MTHDQEKNKERTVTELTIQLHFTDKIGDQCVWQTKVLILCMIFHGGKQAIISLIPSELEAIKYITTYSNNMV